MYKNQILSSLNKIANDLDEYGIFAEANKITGIMLKIAQNYRDDRFVPKQSNKLDKVAQQLSQGQMPANYSGPLYSGAKYFNNSTTPKEIMDIRKKLVPTDFRAEIARVENKKFINPSLLDSNDAQSFVNNLFLFGKGQGITNLTQAFDAFANAGATFNGDNISNNQTLKNLYMMIRQTPRMLTPNEILNTLNSLLNGGQVQQEQIGQQQKQTDQKQSESQDDT